MIKRAFDVFFAGVGLLLLWPVVLLIGMIIKFSDRGPVFYGQVRIGQFGKRFRIWKFRSMVVGADKMGAVVTGEGDGRITRIGALLRKTKLDELPQLWNVLAGEMSFVGPRPEVPRYVEFYSARGREILKYKPGITDLASLLFRHEETLLRGADDVEEFYLRYCVPRKIELNLWYQERANVFRDLAIIARTMCAMLGDFVRPVFARCGSLSRIFGGERGSSSEPGGLGEVQRIAIIGTGEAAKNLVSNFKRSDHPTRQVVAFFDDNPWNWHKRPHDVPVVGMPECLLNGDWSSKIDEVIVTPSGEEPERQHEISELLKPLGMKVTIVSRSLVLLEA